MKKYKASIYDMDIKEVECLRETAKQVFITEKWFSKPKEFRHSKLTNDGGYFDTKEEAIKWKADDLASKALAAYQEHKQTQQMYVEFCGVHKIPALSIKR